MSSRLIHLTLLLFWLCQALPAADTNWSADLLREVLETKGRQTDTFKGEEGRGAHKTEGLLLKSYQLRHLRLGESARGKSALNLLSRLLPPGSSLKVDAPANSIHLLASSSAHAAAWDFLSTLDVPSEGQAVAAQDLSPTLQELLKKLEQAQGGTRQIAESVERIQAELQRDRVERINEGKRQAIWLYPAGGILLCAVGFVGWRSLRRRNEGSLSLEQADRELSLAAHELLGSNTVATRQQRELQQEMLGAINAAAIRMEAWYNEQKSQRDQLTKVVGDQEMALRDARIAFGQAKDELLGENRALLDRAGARFELSAVKLDENIQQLDKQHGRVEALAGELQSTVQELDQTKDEILRLQGMLEHRGEELEKARQRLDSREAELTHQQAKLAALTLILEEGSWPEQRPPEASKPSLNEAAEIPPPAGERQGTSGAGRNATETQSENTDPLCKTTTCRTSYQFLPPDYPET